MESDLRQQHHQFQSPQHQLPQRQQQQMSSSGLMRYRSAPSSYFANFLDDSESYLGTARPSSPETERIIARFMSEDSSAPPEELGEVQENSHSRATETQEFRPELIGSPLPVVYQSSSSRPPLPNHSSKAAVSGPEMDRSPYRAMASVAQTKMGAANTSNLVRHSSSPAGFFSNLNVENGYVTIRGMGNMGSMGSSKGEACFSSANRLKGEINFSSGPPPPPPPAGLMNHMSDIGNKSLGTTSPEKGTYGKEGPSDNDGFLTGFPVGSWEDSHTENYTGLKRAREDDRKIYSGLNASEIQHGGGPSVMLSRHMSLPKTSAEMASVEKYLQFQDSVPCKIRAKRGCATHPRSIAERVRRTRISERMRKLQELVPNMDKQTSNAEMLDLAVDYIKDLQKQLKTLSENRAKCTCSNNRKP